MTRQHVIHDKRTDPKSRSPRRETVRELKRGGKTYAEIGEIMGISRQRAQQLIRPTKKERLEMIEAAHGICQNCGNQSKKLDAHHDDYANAPTRLLCPSCHKTADSLMNPKPKRERKRPEWLNMHTGKRIDLHFTVAPSTQQELIDLKDKTKVPMTRLIDEAINLYYIVRLAKHSIVCTPTAIGVEISEVPQEPTV